MSKYYLCGFFVEILGNKKLEENGETDDDV
jgi:hypothetical protein